MVGVRPLVAGGPLALLDGKSRWAYWREENDPTWLRSASPGKLVRFFLDSRDHVNAGEPYAEIEVMKMLMPLIAAKDGTITFVKQPGVSLEPGDILGNPALDDPTCVEHAKPFEGLLPSIGPPNAIGNKPLQRLHASAQVLHNIQVDGFDNQATTASTLKDLWTVLRDPELPFSMYFSTLAALSGRLPSKDATGAAIDTAHSKPAPPEFPAACLRKTELEKVAALVSSHSKAQSKNKLFLTLLEEIQRGAPGPAIGGVEESLNEVLRGIAVLESRSATQVALMAREVLICTQQPSYEERSLQMEQVLVTQLLTDSKFIAYGMLPGFFAHNDGWVLVASMDVYVRRAYRAYNLISVGYEEGDDHDDGDAPNIVMWRFKLGQSSSPPPTPCFNNGININTPKRAGSVGDLTHIVNSRKLIHTGSIANSLNCDALLNAYEKVAEQLPRFNIDKYSCRHEAGAELPNALYFARHVCAPSNDMEDNEWREKLIALVDNGASILKERGMRPDRPNMRSTSR
ncbi:acetyl-CoA carboxylase [Ceratobasidium sp. AG-Ba]|nr:acetyl-CoA carboxylase [Ceratobasidium sp. AG-Ba]